MKSLLLYVLSVLSVVRSQVQTGELYVHALNTIFVACDFKYKFRKQHPEFMILFVEMGKKPGQCIQTTVDDSNPEKLKLITHELHSYRYPEARFKGPFVLGAGEDGSLRFFANKLHAWIGIDIEPMLLHTETRYIVTKRRRGIVSMQLKADYKPLIEDTAYILQDPKDGVFTALPTALFFNPHPIPSDTPSSMTMPINVGASTDSSLSSSAAPPEELSLELTLRQPGQ